MQFSSSPSLPYRRTPSISSTKRFGEPEWSTAANLSANLASASAGLASSESGPRRRKQTTAMGLLCVIFFVLQTTNVFSVHKTSSTPYLVDEVPLHSAFARASPSATALLESHLPQASGLLPTSFAPIVLPYVTADQLSEVCDCSNPAWPRYPAELRFDGPVEDESQLATFIHSTLMDKYCNGVYIFHNASGPHAPPRDPDVQSKLVHRAADRVEDVISWRVDGLRLGVPTSYIFTKTSPLARTGVKRERYLARTAERLRKFRDDVNARGYEDSTPADGRQFVWIVVEDNVHISQDVSHMLATTGLPYLYVAYGLTTHFGNAQHNLALGLIHALSDPANMALGHGPVLSVDDDAEVLPELFEMVWKVKRIGTWPMGNLGPDGWEGPVYDDQNHLIDWPCWSAERRFPLDNGAFSFNSSLLGTTLPGPRFWPTDIQGGESEFISLIVDRKEDIEPLCYNCHVAWHNQLNL